MTQPGPDLPSASPFFLIFSMDDFFFYRHRQRVSARLPKAKYGFDKSETPAVGGGVRGDSFEKWWGIRWFGVKRATAW